MNGNSRHITAFLPDLIGELPLTTAPLLASLIEERGHDCRLYEVARVDGRVRNSDKSGICKPVNVERLESWGVENSI